MVVTVRAGGPLTGVNLGTPTLELSVVRVAGVLPKSAKPSVMDSNCSSESFSIVVRTLWRAVPDCFWATGRQPSWASASAP